MGIGEQFEFEKTGRIDPEPLGTGWPFRVYGCPKYRCDSDPENWVLVGVAKTEEEGHLFADDYEKHRDIRDTRDAWKYKVEAAEEGNQETVTLTGVVVVEEKKPTHTVLRAAKEGIDAGVWRVLGVTHSLSAAEDMVAANKRSEPAESLFQYRYKIRSEKTQTERAPSYCQREQAKEEHAAKVRAVILKHLVAMREEFQEFGQTTHASIYRPQCNLTNVCKALDECGRRPDPLTISELCQRIHGFVKFIEYEANEKGPV